MEKGGYAEAEACFRNALTLVPDSLETMLNLGYALDKQGRSAEARNSYESILEIDPQHPKARYNRAMHLLRAGNLTTGFSDYEYRFAALKHADSRCYSQPRWDGSPLAGRSILVYCEQGLGDAIQFARYIKLLAEKGGRVILEVQHPLLSLFALLDGVEYVVEKSENPPVTDVHIPLLSLPCLFGTTLLSVPASIPYILPPIDTVIRWKKLIGNQHDGLRVGVVWAGKTSPDPDRTCPPEHLAPLLAVRGIKFYSLQIAEKEQWSFSGEQSESVIDLTSHIEDFSDTAALLAHLDLLVTIDTAAAHLAGAMGNPVWVMLTHAADWRWMLDRDDTPWYPTMRLFRQPQAGDWDSVVRQVAEALSHLVVGAEGGDEFRDESEQNASFHRSLTAIESGEPAVAIPLLIGLLGDLPEDPALWFALGRAYDEAGFAVEAERAFRKVLQYTPDSPAVWFALGDSRLKRKAHPEAAFCLRKAHLLKPESVEILLSLGSALTLQGELAAAMEICKKILFLRPDYAQVRYNLAALQLRCGEYSAGFANFESRLAVDSFDIDRRSYPQPRWDGSPLNGRSILVFCEQGMGDVIQFARYFPLLSESGGSVVLEMDPPLIPLFEAFPGVELIVAKSDTPPLTDVYIQSMSLPYMFGTTLETVPSRIPYLFADAKKTAAWRRILVDGSGCQIGLVWRGSSRNPRDGKRSCPMNALSALSGLTGVRLISLQTGDEPTDTPFAPYGLLIENYSGFLTDFTETLALIDNLDLVISVDTAVAHLAGAMGKQVWVMLPQDSEWRWLAGRENSPWYPTMRLFEHRPNGTWEELAIRVRSALDSWLAGNINLSGWKAVDPESAYETGSRLKDEGDLAGAERCFRDIVVEYPDLPDPQHSLGVVLHLQGRLREAIHHYCKAVALDPGFVKAHYNLANAYLQCGLYREAQDSASDAVSCDSSYADAHWLLGMLLLRQGNFSRGWQEYEWRWKAAEFTSRIPEFGRHLWDGSPLEGRTLLIHMEQGRGDMIQFIRYAPLAAARGGDVVVCAVSELVSLMETVPGVRLAVDREGPLPPFDLHIPVQSLPLVFGTTLDTTPHNVPYLKPDPAKIAAWHRLFPDENHFRIGLAWQGSRDHRDDHNRSCRLLELLPLSTLEDVELYSLQVGSGVEQIRDLPETMNVIEPSGIICDYSDTVAIIAQLDLVVSVDTSVAHLAGAMGKPVWTLLPYVSEWRWLLDRDDTPWYPTMRLFRQRVPGDWQELINRVRSELAALLSSARLLNRWGIIQLTAGFPERAEHAFWRATACAPNDTESHCNRGVALDALRRHEDAITCYERALSIIPDFYAADLNKGQSLLSLGRLQEARACFELAAAHSPASVAAYVNLGECAKLMSDFDGARAAFEKAREIGPCSAGAWRGIAEICQAEERFEDAVATYERSLECCPDDVVVLNLLGISYQALERLVEAEGCYRKLLSLTPDNQKALNNLAVVLNAQGRLEEAVKAYRHLLELDPEYADGHWNLSVALLAMGEYAEGWREFEWRFKKSNPVKIRHFSQPLWDGSSLEGKTILLHAEQGFGDTIQFVRYLPLLVQRGARVYLECQVPALKRLLLSLDGVSGVFSVGEPLPAFDCHLALLSLPRLFNTTQETIPSQVPYLSADHNDTALWHSRLGGSGRFRVGLVWHAKQSQVLNRKRSCPLSFFSPLWVVEGVEFYSLQVGMGSEQLEDFCVNHEMHDLTAGISEFADTAALIANLDLVITIDTAVAHLAGALGARTWVILPHVAEWRWLCNRTDSPWYTTMRLFRQPVAGDWPALMDMVADTLQCAASGVNENRNRQPARPRKKVGLAWTGRQDNPLNRKRSCPFSELAPLLALDDVDFVSLQMNFEEIAPTGLIDMTGQILDFEDTAALMANLDLVISVDTSVAHLAAATGRPVWVLLSHVPDWRWLAVNDTPVWYPHVRIFRQERHGDWKSVISSVVVSLERLCSGRDEQCSGEQLDQPSEGPSYEKIELELQLESHVAMLVSNPVDLEARMNVGASLAMLGRYDEAAVFFREVLKRDDSHIGGHLNLAYALLSTKNYGEGWQHFEWRLRRIPEDQLPPWPFLARHTLGKHSKGTSLLVHCEQGFGDTILFCRFLPWLAKAGYRVVVSCQPSLASLIESVKGVNLVVEHGEILPDCEFQVLMLSLPFLFSVTPEVLICNIPYITPRPENIILWKELLQKKYDMF